MKAKDPTQYRQAWQWHIDQIASLALAAGITYDRFTGVKKELELWIDEAHRNMIDNEANHE